MSTHGICRHHQPPILYTWKGKPLLRDALCAECKLPLERTASNLLQGVGPWGGPTRVWNARAHPLWEEKHETQAEDRCTCALRGPLSCPRHGP